MRIVFMGTPDFAVPCLRQVLEDGYEVAGVFTQPDKPKGRSFTLTPPPVKILAQERGLPVYQPATLRDGQALETLRALAPQLAVVVAYGKILPPALLAVPPLGCINVHGSLLPRWRGAAPIQWSVLSGDQQAGVTTMYLAEGMDTGDMILRRSTPVGPQETSGQLYERLAELGAQLLGETVELIAQGRAPRTPQQEEEATYAPMLTKELAAIDFMKPAAQVHNLVRGMNPWPVAHTLLEGQPLKVYAARLAEGSGAPGQVLESRGRLVVACGQGAVELLELQAQGKKRMAAADYLRGHPLAPGTVLGI